MDITKAIRSLRPGSEFVTCDDEITHWFDDTISPPTKEEIEDEMRRLQAEFDAKEYARQRAKEYPAIGDQLDALFHAGVFPPEMAAMIQAVKDKYPKEQS